MADKPFVVFVSQARDLLAADYNGRSDPYVKLTYGAKTFKTAAQLKTLSPIFNETFTFEKWDPSASDILEVQVWDQDFGVVRKFDDPLGKISVAIGKALDKGPIWYKLTPVQKEKTTGEIELEIKSPQGFSSSEESGSFLPEFTIHFDKIGGAIIKGSSLLSPSALALSSYCTYTISLTKVPEIFGQKTQPWNTKYDKAQKIFGAGTQASLIRTTIHAQHKTLHSSWRCQKGKIANAAQLFNLLNYGIVPGSTRRRVFTYVILEDKWLFSETTAQYLQEFLEGAETKSNTETVKDFLSKHAVHADAAESVRYSGEFHVQQEDEGPDTGKWKLIIDNNSGTYSPDKNDLKLLEEVFKKNFPGILVEAFDFKDPKLKAYIDKLTVMSKNPVSPHTMKRVTEDQARNPLPVEEI